jgi:transposase
MDAIVITNKRMRAERAVKHRNQTIRHICAAGWRDWSRNSGYSQRALVEATMSRSKRAFTSPIRARTDAARRVSATLRVAYLNHNLVPAMNTS